MASENSVQVGHLRSPVSLKTDQNTLGKSQNEPHDDLLAVAIRNICKYLSNADFHTYLRSPCSDHVVQPVKLPVGWETFTLKMTRSLVLKCLNNSGAQVFMFQYGYGKVQKSALP